MPIINEGKIKVVSDVVKNELWRECGFCRTTLVAAAVGADRTLKVGDLLASDGSDATTADTFGIFLGDALGNQEITIADGDSTTVVVLDKGSSIVTAESLTKAGAALTVNPSPAEAKAALQAKYIKVSEEV